MPAVTRTLRLAGVPANEWDTLAGGFYASHRWLHAQELAYSPSPTVVATEAGRLAGALPTWSGDGSGLFSLPEPWDRRLLWLGGRRVTANAPVGAVGPLWPEVRAYAEERGLAGVVWPYLDASVASMVAPEGAQVVLHSADAELTVPPGGLTELMATAKNRRDWRRELRVFAENGGTVEWRPLTAELFAPLAILIAGTRAKYGSPGGPARVWRELAAQQETGVAATAVVSLVRTGSRITAAAVFYRWHDWLYGRYWGAAPDAPPFSYYVLTHYAAVDWAAERGFRVLHLSISNWSAKAARGATLRPQAMVVDVLRGKPPPEVVRQHNAAVAAAWRDRFRRRPEALHTSWSDWE